MINIKKKIVAFVTVIFILLCLLIFKIAYIQIVKGEEYQKKAIIQQVSKIDKKIESVRGHILDRNNEELVINRRYYNVILDNINFNKLTEEKKNVTLKKLSNLLEIDINELVEKAKFNTHYKVLKKSVTKDTVDKIKEDKVNNVWFEDFYKRKYINGRLASNLIGFSNDNKGLWGIEKKYNEYLKGENGRKFITFKGNNILTEEQISPKNGRNLVLTIDKNIQEFCEKEMKDAVQKYNPKNMVVLVMNPNTGEILGMCSYPNFDLNSPMEVDLNIRKINEDYNDKNKIEKLSAIWKNYVINDTYEPGSTFKAITVATALEEDLIRPNEKFICKGYKDVWGTKIACGNKYGHGSQTLDEALANSCNVAMMDIAERIGKTKFSYYQKLFGFGEQSGIDLYGEASGILHKEEKMGPVELATSSFGQSFNATPIQMITAFASVINGGNLLKPYVVSNVLDDDNNIIMKNEKIVRRKTISKDTSMALKNALGEVVKSGTGHSAYIEGYEIGGKTATSEKYPRGSKKYIASFISFAPVKNPKFITLVLLDEPQGKKYGGGSVAGPITKNLDHSILKYLGIPKIDKDILTKKENVQEEMVVIDDYIHKDLVNSLVSLKNYGLKSEVIGNGNKIFNQIPKPGMIVPKNAEVLLYVQSESEVDLVVVPNLVGLTYNKAQEILMDSGLSIKNSKYTGQKIINQIPQAGKKVDKNTQIYVELGN